MVPHSKRTTQEGEKTMLDTWTYLYMIKKKKLEQPVITILKMFIFKTQKTTQHKMLYNRKTEILFFAFATGSSKITSVGVSLSIAENMFLTRFE